MRASPAGQRSAGHRPKRPGPQPRRDPERNPAPAGRQAGSSGEASDVSSRAYAARVPQTRRRIGRRVGPGRVRWDRVGRVALVLVLFGVVVSYLNPIVNLVDAWRDSRASEERLGELQAKHEKLQRRVRDAATTLAVEREARKLGMVRGGERLYVVRGLDE